MLFLNGTIIQTIHYLNLLFITQFLFEFTLDLISLYSNTQFLIEIIQYTILFKEP